jgi:hypothetical protein
MQRSPFSISYTGNSSVVILNLKKSKSPGIDQIPVELFKARGKTIRCAIHKRIVAI